MALELPEATLWSDLQRRRFFVIPDAETLPPGDFALHTLTGRSLRVDPAAAVRFEVTEDEAKAWLKGEFGTLLDTARGAIDRFIEKLRSASSGNTVG